MRMSTTTSFPRGRHRAPQLSTSALAALALVLSGCATEHNGAEASGGGDAINLVVPFNPGGSADGTARQLAAEARTTCGRDIIIRNETGGSGAVGFQSVASAAPDGTTIGVAAIELAILPHLGVSPIGPESIHPIMQYSEQPLAYAVPVDSDIDSIEELLSTDEDVTVASSGTGSIYHIGFAGAAQQAEQPNLRNVPYAGAAPAIQSTLGGETDVTSAGAAEIAPYVSGGQMRTLAIASDTRIDILADTPTLAEAGLDWTSHAILGLFAPADTPDDVITDLNECFNQARESPAFSEYMDNLGFTQEYKDAADFAEFLNEEYERYGDVTEEAGLRNQP